MGKLGSGRKNYSVLPTDYKLLEEIGYGASATVYRAIYLPFNEVVAVKCLDLDRCNSNLDDIRREAQTMSLIDHPNVIRAYCSFVVDRCLWVVMPFMAEGSCLHLMKIAYPDGFEEPVICSILKETLKALEYLHRHGHIHRDVKAGNILLDSGGIVKLGDFGVSACMFDKGDRQRSRNTFVGTPCWMAPEVLQPGSGYDFKADIWSFGITALELAHGHAPFSKYPPMKVLLMTIQNAPPGLDYERDKKFSKSFKEMVAMCLVKDQTKRPTAEKLLKHSFFKHAKSPEVSVKHILADLPPLWDRVKALQLKDAAQLALKRMPSAEQEALSQSEYKRGVSAWNFDIEDLKAQASLIQDDEDLIGMREEDEDPRILMKDKASSSSHTSSGKSALTAVIGRENTRNASVSEGRHSKEEVVSLESAVSTNEPTTEIQSSTPKGKIGKSCGGEDKVKNNGGNHTLNKSNGEQPVPSRAPSLEGELGPDRGELSSQSASEKVSKRDARKESNLSGPLMLPKRASMNSLSAPIRTSGGYRDLLEDKTKANVVQIKGRFSVTSENVDVVKDIPLCAISRRSQESQLRKSASVGDWQHDNKPMPVMPKEICDGSASPSALVGHLQNLFQQTVVQQDLITNLISSLQQNEFVDGKLSSQVPTLGSDALNEAAPSERERLLLTKVSELQNRVSSLTDELMAERAKYMHLQQQLNDIPNREKIAVKKVGKIDT
ncbi:serine/threonine-protein kinase BLUS1-like isoform X3 [Nymphaea colorata]|uniref:serine/threonine-protein kinase BLUS1-like isoform X3 n=1 Tax=Nymphaea colorata TaxID=210225 RepID=UPI00129DC59F|nr:serine/threonine-protein kinase BLUS1-like isoform X3 [Nymphaea colorata]